MCKSKAIAYATRNGGRFWDCGIIFTTTLTNNQSLMKKYIITAIAFATLGLLSSCGDNSKPEDAKEAANQVNDKKFDDTKWKATPIGPLRRLMAAWKR